VLLETDPLETNLLNKSTSIAVAPQLGCCEMSVNDWLKYC